jgi:hypothetical protein
MSSRSVSARRCKSATCCVGASSAREWETTTSTAQAVAKIAGANLSGSGVGGTKVNVQASAARRTARPCHNRRMADHDSRGRGTWLPGISLVAGRVRLAEFVDRDPLRRHECGVSRPGKARDSEARCSPHLAGERLKPERKRLDQVVGALARLHPGLVADTEGMLGICFTTGHIGPCSR